MDEVEAIVADKPSDALLRARIRAILLLRDYTTTSLVQETERLYMALELIAFSTRDDATAQYARAILDPVVKLP
jgi:hypothetical protein